MTFDLDVFTSIEYIVDDGVYIHIPDGYQIQVWNHANMYKSWFNNHMEELELEGLDFQEKGYLDVSRCLYSLLQWWVIEYFYRHISQEEYDTYWAEGARRDAAAAREAARRALILLDAVALLDRAANRAAEARGDDDDENAHPRIGELGVQEAVVRAVVRRLNPLPITGELPHLQAICITHTCGDRVSHR